MSQKQLWWTIGILVVVIIGIWLIAKGNPPMETTTTTDTTYSTTTVDTTPVVISTTTMATTTAPTSSSTTMTLWTAFKKAYSCKLVALNSITKVLSFRNEGATTTVDGSNPYKCMDGRTWVY